MTGVVLAMVVVMALVLLGVDSIIGLGMRTLFGA